DFRQLVEEPRRMDGLAVVLLTFFELRFPRRAVLRDPRDARLAVSERPKRAKMTDQLAQRRFRVADETHFHRVDLADLLWLDVDLDQPRRRNGEGEAWIPRAAVRFGKRGPDGQHDIGVLRGRIRDGRAPDACHPEGQRVALREDAF